MKLQDTVLVLVISVALMSIYFSHPLYVFLFWLSMITGILVLLSVVLVLLIHFKLSVRHVPTLWRDDRCHRNKRFQHFRSSLLHEYHAIKGYVSPNSSKPYPIIFGRVADGLLQQLMEFIVRDFVCDYLKDYSNDLKSISEKLKEDLWSAVQLLHDRCLRVDYVKLLACDVISKITHHFERIRESNNLAVATDTYIAVWNLSPIAVSSNSEVDFFRYLSEMVIMLLLPRTYSLSPSKYLMREILTFKVFIPFINLISDPDYINLCIVNYMETEKCNNASLKLFECAKSLEDMLKIINKHDVDVETLKSIRYHLVTKLMQATTLQNLQRSKGVDLNNERNSLASASVSRHDINSAKKLGKYVQQLTVAKKECEKRLTALGSEYSYRPNSHCNKSMTITTILEQVIGRKYLSQFLATVASQDLIRFWTAVEELRSSNRQNWHQLGAEIFYTFIRKSTSEIKIDIDTRKRMEAFLLGDKGPDIFYHVQYQVVQILEEKYYQSFLISDYYREMLLALQHELEPTLDTEESNCNGEEKSGELNVNTTSNNSLNVEDHSNYAKLKLDQLEEKLTNKTLALEALRTCLKQESRILCKLEKQVEWLEGERRQLEAHLSRTEIWSENLGKWRTVVQSVEVPDERESPQFVLVVHMETRVEFNDNSELNENNGISTGWVVCRSLSQFQQLHRKLRLLCTELRYLELPSNTFKFLFGKSDKPSLEKAKKQIQRYLNFILNDDKLNQSETVYAFLSPSSDHLKQSTIDDNRKNRFFFSTLFNKTSTVEDQSDKELITGRDTHSDCEQVSLDSVSLQSDSTDVVCKSNESLKTTSSNHKDSIAEPLYGLLTELFDMKGLFKSIRKTLIGFVQVTYGRNINRQIHETISWCFSEQMLHYYITAILKSFWPGGTLAASSYLHLALNLEHKQQTMFKAYKVFVNNVPELVTVLVGNNAAKNGARKIFQALQEKTLNKQLLLEILQIVMDAVLPEISL